MSDFETQVEERVAELVGLVGIENETSSAAEFYQSDRRVSGDGEPLESGRGRAVQVAYNRMFARLGQHHASDAIESTARSRAAERVADQLESL